MYTVKNRVLFQHPFLYCSYCGCHYNTYELPEGAAPTRTGVLDVLIGESLTFSTLLGATATLNWNFLYPMMLYTKYPCVYMVWSEITCIHVRWVVCVPVIHFACTVFHHLMHQTIFLPDSIFTTVCLCTFIFTILCYWSILLITLCISRVSVNALHDVVVPVSSKGGTFHSLSPSTLECGTWSVV